MSTNLNWKNIGEVAAQKGFDKNLGTAGLVKGVIGNYLIFGGGANFKNGILPVDGGVKINHKDLYLYKEVDRNLELIDQVQFDYPLAYGPSVVYKDTLFYIATKDETTSEVLAITVENDKLHIEKLHTIPFTFENIIAEIHKDTLYFGIGTVNGKNTNELYSYSLTTHNFEVIGEFPGLPRSQALAHVYNNSLIIYGGGADVTYHDGYKFDLNTKTWTKLEDIIIDGEEISLHGADWTNLNEDELLVIGGFNKDVWKDAVFNLTTLTGDEKAKYRDAYFHRPIADFKWNKLELVYNLKENRWSKFGEIPFDAPCGHALLSTDHYIYSIMGEVKPAVRSPYIYQCEK